MKIAIFKWVLGFVLKTLNGYLDPEEAARVADYERRRDEMEANHAERQVAIASLDKDIEFLAVEQQKRKESIAQAGYEISQLDIRLKQISDEKNKKLSDLRDLSDDAVLRSDL